ncbi:hypothetical protein HPB48_022420 [Haemaphysalis longicornis]|uniref:Uncharacterized protein n=1 Tax=Haemaphysalis longicornis TaxID=44386 RepID=A0A9J6FZQ2_HAELO|nr:hypothetical protein HPB48_022420 [Haemaphysalis longicornis]
MSFQARTGATCSSCLKARTQLIRRKYKLKLGDAAKRRKASLHKKNLRQSNQRLKTQLRVTKHQLMEMKKANRNIKEQAFEKRIEELQPKQQKAALYFFRASKRKGMRGMDFTRDLILECLFMNMKSPQLYNYIRKSKILVLPCKNTLRKYLSAYKTGFSFCTKVLAGLKQRTRNMDILKRHGGILVTFQ